MENNKGMGVWLKAYLQVCRFEYLPGEAVALLVPFFLAAGSVWRMLSLPVIEAYTIFILLYLTGFTTNALADREIDSKYATFKSKIPNAVEIIGVNRLKVIILLHVLVAVGLAIHLSIIISDLLPIILVAIGILLGLGYSLKPFHFKVRGVWHGIALATAAFFIPFFFLIYIVGGGISPQMIVFIVGFTFVHYGMEFGNQAIDYLEDKEEGVRTPPVRWGLSYSLAVAMWCAIVGMLIEAPSLYYIVLARTSSWILSPTITYLVLQSVLIAGYIIPLHGLLKMYRSTKKLGEHRCMPVLHKTCKYARWQLSGISGLMVVSLILFAIGQTSIPMQNNGMVFDVEIPSKPTVEYYVNTRGVCMANITFIIENDGTCVINPGEVYILITADCPPGFHKSMRMVMERELNVGSAMNISASIDVHDVDDTELLIELYHLNDSKVLDRVIIPRSTNIYIYNTSIQYETKVTGRVANISATVYNCYGVVEPGELKIEVKYYTQDGVLRGINSVNNDDVIANNTVWKENIRVNVPPTPDLIFDVTLCMGSKILDSCVLVC